MAPFSGLILSLLLESALGMKMRCSLPRLPANYSSERLTVDTAQKTVWLIFSNVQVRHVSHERMTITLRIGMSFSWYDKELESLHSSMGCKELRLDDQQGLWTPLSKVEILNDIDDLPTVFSSRRARFGIFDYGSMNDSINKDVRVYAYNSFITDIFCKMDFANYPLDHHKCAIWFEGFGWDSERLVLSGSNMEGWLDPSALSFQAELSPATSWNVTYPGWGTFSLSGFNMTLTRIMRPYIFNIYIPTTILIIASWISFLIPVKLIPGRMALLVTILLMLIGFATHVTEKSPSANNVSALDLWMLMAIIFVSLALFEYAIVLLLSYKFELMEEERVVKIVERVSSVVFPLTFVAFNAVYWTHYTKE